jgi:hypothetical protein
VCRGFGNCICTVWIDWGLGHSDAFQVCLDSDLVSTRHTFELFPVVYWLASSNDIEHSNSLLMMQEVGNKNFSTLLDSLSPQGI